MVDFSFNIDRNLSSSVRKYLNDREINVNEKQMNEVLQRMHEINEQRKTSKEESIFSGGHKYLGGSGKDFVVKSGQKITLTREEYNKVFEGLLDPVETIRTKKLDISSLERPKIGDVPPVKKDLKLSSEYVKILNDRFKSQLSQMSDKQLNEFSNSSTDIEKLKLVAQEFGIRGNQQKARNLARTIREMEAQKAKEAEQIKGQMVEPGLVTGPKEGENPEYDKAVKEGNKEEQTPVNSQQEKSVVELERPTYFNSPEYIQGQIVPEGPVTGPKEGKNPKYDKAVKEGYTEEVPKDNNAPVQKDGKTPIKQDINGENSAVLNLVENSRMFKDNNTGMYNIRGHKSSRLSTARQNAESSMRLLYQRKDEYQAILKKDSSELTADEIQLKQLFEEKMQQMELMISSDGEIINAENSRYIKAESTGKEVKPADIGNTSNAQNAEMPAVNEVSSEIKSEDHSNSVLSGVVRNAAANIPQDLPQNEIEDILKLNDPSNANKKGVMIGNQYYDFDDNGRCERIYKEPPAENINGTKNSYMFLSYNDEGDIDSIYHYIEGGEISEDGTRLAATYDAKGELTQYYVESKFDPKSGDPGRYDIFTKSGELSHSNIVNFDEAGKEISSTDYDKDGLTTHIEKYNKKGQMIATDDYDKDGNIIKLTRFEYDKDGNKVFEYNILDEKERMAFKIFSNIDDLTQEELSQIINDINNMDLSDYKDEVNDDEDVDNLYYVMESYANCSGRYMLDDIAQKDPKLADSIIEDVKQQNKTNRNFFKQKHRNTKDIFADMEEHPNDYKKLTVDAQRLMHRSSYNKYGNGNNNLKLNNEFDEKIEQKGTGNCYLISTLGAIDKTSQGREALNSLRENLPNGDVKITCKGNGKTYTITKEEIINADYLSTGDDDMRVWEIAMDKYRRDMAYENPGVLCDAEGGTMQDVTEAFFGLEAETISDKSIIESIDFSASNNVYTFSVRPDNNIEYPAINVKDKKNNDVELVTDHEYQVARVSGDRIYFINPWDTSKELSMSLEELKNTEDLYISKFDITSLS